jgi:hypothetical protein
VFVVKSLSAADKNLPQRHFFLHDSTVLLVRKICFVKLKALEKSRNFGLKLIKRWKN